MDNGYDEILSDNPFFIELKNEYTNLFQHCIEQSWIICVPRIGSLNTRVFTIEDFCAHLLVPNDELPETNYSTLTEKQVTISNKVITVELAKGLPLQSHILFEETFYTEDFIKYKVWCIETPLEPASITDDHAIFKDYLTSINDCIDLLWTQAAGRQVLDQIEHSVHMFMKKHSSLPVAMSPLRDIVSELYTQCLQIALQNRCLREKSKACKQVLDNIKLAVECYMQHLLFDFLFKTICTCCAYEDSHLNKKIRNMSDIQLRDLDIKKELYHAVPKAKQILSKINSYHTVLEKLLCIKQALNAINNIDTSNNIVLLTADDLLPVFVFLVIKSGLPNWYSQLTFMKEFHFSGVGKGDGDQSAFLITTLEAVIEHIQSGALAGPPDPEAYYYESNLTEENINNNQRKSSLTESISTSDTNSRDETLEYIFELIKANHSEQVQSILQRNQKYLRNIQQHQTNILKVTLNGDTSNDDDENDVDIYNKLCHPLCNCQRCCSKISKNVLKTSPTVASRDSHGLTALHIACIHGKATIVESLIDMGSNVNATDVNECTPLHYASSRGHQNALLLLLHSGANINETNIDKNTPLHLSVNNGHMNCVKAIIYFAEHSRKKVIINCVNESGNTPLHLASKWGYEGIARLLIENGAEPSLPNKNNKTAFDYAHNLKILNVLKSCTPNLYEYIHITSTDINTLNHKSDDSISLKLKKLYVKTNKNNSSNAVENLKLIDRILQAISYGDVKLACFYMNINYEAFVDNANSTKALCHPLCECTACKKKCEACTDFEVNISDSFGFTPLHYAARYGLDELCNILLLNKANVNCVNKKGQTPLHLAVLNNHTIVIRTLLDNGANINVIDSTGNTPLHDASEMGHIGATKVLLSYNPDTSMLNGSEKSSLAVAKDKVHLTIIDLIEKHRSKI
ncbi:ankyrin repeat domain-containing protein 27-like [Galleria mellonella]|uniref:Ankyrin repeat domain-containing protein 27-like n=1 Tax=Galleria mellonella TaxID=7137 RepID=A0A6J1WE45_GALME|nr:ankyrin repeat domain-containing protein 27-like [Galleria mellonella]XP_052759448.1 ankyrin repeat domain-containing protein 27-like [Galleria mellonella]